MTKTHAPKATRQIGEHDCRREVAGSCAVLGWGTPPKTRAARGVFARVARLRKNAGAAPRWDTTDNASHYLVASGSESLTRYDPSANRNNAPRCPALAYPCLLAKGSFTLRVTGSVPQRRV